MSDMVKSFVAEAALGSDRVTIPGDMHRAVAAEIERLRGENARLRTLYEMTNDFVSAYGEVWAKAHAIDDHVCELDHKDEMDIAEFMLKFLDTARKDNGNGNA